MLKIAVIGAGYWGTNLVRVFKELGVLKLVCDTNKKNLKTQSNNFPGIETTNSLIKVLQDKNIDAVVISTPAATHYRITKLALLHEKHVFVEKPLALNSKEGKELLDLARETNRVLMVGHILCYHPAIIKLKRLIRSGKLGKIRHIYSNRLNIGKLRTEENILWSFAPHDISVILMLLEKEPINVIAYGGDYINNGIYDTTLTALDFGNGVKGHIFVSWLHPFKEQKLIVVGSRAMAVFDDLSSEKLLIYPHKIRWKNGKIPIAVKAEHYAVKIKKKEPLKEEARHFIECVTGGKTPRTDAREALRVLKVLEIAEESIKFNNGYKGDGLRKKYFVHPTSCIDENVKIGDETKVWHFSHILKNTKIGKQCVIGQNVAIGPDVKIGDKCKIQNNVSIYKGVILEDEVFCGPSCVFTNVNTPRAFIERKKEFLNTLVKKGATIGANATIICGAIIGKYAFVGAGAVVKKDVADYALVLGVPARQVGWVCKCGRPLKMTSTKKITRCAWCGSRYKLYRNKLMAVQETI
jgi:UDP-2-acetamido-3-amino-2,3-dideoxy-glucuronate N-acetyltransferase